MDADENKLDITIANEQEITSLIEAKSFDEVINFAKQLNKLIVVTNLTILYFIYGLAFSPNGLLYAGGHVDDKM